MADSENGSDQPERQLTAAEQLNAYIFQVASGRYGKVAPTPPDGFRTPGPTDESTLVEHHSHSDLTSNRHDRVWIGRNAVALPFGIERMWIQTEQLPAGGLPIEADVGWSIGDPSGKDMTAVTINRYDELAAKLADGFWDGLSTKLVGPDDQGLGMLAACSPEIIDRVVTSHGMDRGSAADFVLANAPEQAWRILDAAATLSQGPFSFDEPTLE